MIPSAEGVSLGGKAFPSYVAIAADGTMLIGEPARRQAAANPEGTATAFKRQMGTRQKIRLRNREFTPEELSAFLLGKIKRDAEAFLGEPVKDAVVTVTMSPLRLAIQPIVMVWRLDFSSLGSVSSSMPSFIDALALESSTSAGRATVRVNAPCEISQR